MLPLQALLRNHDVPMCVMVPMTLSNAAEYQETNGTQYRDGLPKMDIIWLELLFLYFSKTAYQTWYVRNVSFPNIPKKFLNMPWNKECMMIPKSLLILPPFSNRTFGNIKFPSSCSIPYYLQILHDRVSEWHHMIPEIKSQSAYYSMKVCLIKRF